MTTIGFTDVSGIYFVQPVLGVAFMTTILYKLAVRLAYNLGKIGS